MEGVGAPARVITVREHAWKFEPSEMRIKAGEVVKIEFSTTDNGLGAGHGFALDGFDQQVFIDGAMVGPPLSTTFKIDEPGRYNFYCSTQCGTTDLHPTCTAHWWSNDRLERRKAYDTNLCFAIVRRHRLISLAAVIQNFGCAETGSARIARGR